MKNKNTIFTTIFAFATLFASAQITVLSNGNVGLGNVYTSPASLLCVGGNGNSAYEAYIKNPFNTGSGIGLRVDAQTPLSAYNMYAIQGVATSGTGSMYGVEGSAYNGTMQTTGRSYGTLGQAGGATSGYNYGAYGSIIGTNNGAGIFGTTNGDYTIPGIFAGFFYGQIETTNDSPEKPTSGSWSGYSDKRLKQDIAPFTDGLAVLRKVNPITYKFNGIGNLPTAKINIGVLAQDIQQVAPYCVGTSNLVIKQSESANFSSDVIQTLPADSSGEAHNIVKVLNYNYDGLIYVLINSVKQLDSTVTALQAQVAKCCPSSTTQRTEQNNSGDGNNETTINIQLANNSVLYQNEPNPTSSNTTIRYFIPENAQGAYIVFYDFYGREIKKVEVKETGSGKIEADTQNLSEGVYSYSLIVNGKAVDTKKMVKMK